MAPSTRFSQKSGGVVLFYYYQPCGVGKGGGETKNWPPRRPSVVADQARPEGSIRNYLLSIKKGTTNLVKFSGVFEEPARVGVQFGVFRTKYGVFKRFHWNHFANCAHP